MSIRLIIVLGVFLAIACFRSRSDTLVEVPEGYRGWVTVEYGRHGCEPLSRRTGTLFLRIPSSGYLCTSDPIEEGWATDTIFDAGHPTSPFLIAGPTDDESTYGDTRVHGYTNGNSTNIKGGEPTRHWWRFCIGSKAQCEYEELVLPPLPKAAHAD